MKALVSALTLGIAAITQLAPAQQPQPQRLPPTVTADAAVNQVTVQNQRRQRITVYAAFGQFDRRLGSVDGYETKTFPLPAWAVHPPGRVQLFAHVEGEITDLATKEFALRAPARIGMVVPPGDAIATSSADTMHAMIPPEVLEEATLTVDNPRNVPVTVFAEPGAYDVRLGVVPARTRATLRFPRSVVGPRNSLKVFVHVEGGTDLSSELLTVARGQHLGLRVPQ